MKLADEIKNIMNSYNAKVRKEIAKETEEIAKKTAQKLKDKSPKKTGKYAKGWTTKVENAREDKKRVVVHNSKHWQRTHTLENGHAIVNKYGSYGRTRPIVHIKPVEEEMIEEFTKICEEIAEKIGDEI